MRSRAVVNSGWAVLSARTLRTHTPLSVTMSVSGRCNYQCAYCRLWSKPNKSMSFSQVTLLIRQLAEMGMQRIGFTQDEPLIRKDIGEIIDCCKRLGLFVTLGSNGALVADRITSLHNLDLLILSLDGPQSVHDELRVRGAFNNVITALQTARRYGKKVWITSVLSRFNLECVSWLLETARRNGTRIAFQLLYHAPQITGSNEDLLPPAEKYRTAIQKIREAKRMGAPVINSYSQLEFLEKWPDYRNPFFDPQQHHRRFLRCWGGRLFLHVEPNGDIFPCSQRVGQPMALGPENLRSVVSHAARQACRYCCLGADYVEYNLLMGLDPKAIWNAIHNL